MKKKKRTMNELRQTKDTTYTPPRSHDKEKPTTLNFQYDWKAHMKSLILFMEMGNDDNRKFAKEELMKLAEKLDNLNCNENI
jgi:hypothetical protein|tara:strand:- start:317 stop:562 length:246 start_codon:yes stop_codon:yes gene_type:complete